MSDVAGYFIYRNGHKIATVDAFTYSYQDHNRPVGVSFEYSLATFDSNGNISSQVTIIVS